MKKKFTMVKILSVVLTACILVALAAPSIVTISAFIEESVRPLFSSDEDYVGVGDVKPPEINENPYDVRIEFVDAPILNDYMYQMFIKDGTMTSVNTWERPMPGLSPYYTPSITPLYSYKIGYAGEVDSGLPYREGNDKLLQPDLKFGSTTVSVDMTQGPDLKALFPLLNWDQVYLRVGMTGIAGSNELKLERHDNTTAQRIEAEAKDGPESVYLDVPFNDLDSIKKVDFIAYRHGVVTDTHFVLIDNTAPSVTGVDFKKEGGQLILTLTFNEGLHWSDEFVSAETLNEIYVNVLLKGNGNHHLKMFISELGGENNNVLTFKGELGDYQYVNFTAEKIVNVHLPGWHTGARVAVMDVPEKMYYTPVNYLEYDHQIAACNAMFAFSKGPIADYAGNPVDFGAIVGRRLGQRFSPNSFEAEEVIIYNNVTLEDEQQKVEGAPTDWPKDIDKTHMFAGPDNTLTVKMTTYSSLTEEECSKVAVQLNIKNPDGTPLIAKCTSSYSFNEGYTVYGDEGGRAMTCLMFENIKLTEGMTADLAKDEIPQVKVVKMTDEIDGKTAYPYVKEPSRQLYLDLTPPEVSIQRLFMTEPDDGKDYYLLGVKATVAEVMKDNFYSGTLQTYADISLGGGVQRATDAKYLISFDEINQSKVAERLKSEGEQTTVPVNGSTYLGTKPIPSDRQDIFIYIMIESGGLLVDDLSITVEAEDLVGNGAKTETFPVSCQIDEIAPTVNFPKSAKIEFFGMNDSASATVPLTVVDFSDVVSIKYVWNPNRTEAPDVEIGEDGLPVPPSEDQEGGIKWQDLEFTRGKSVTAEITNQYGGLDDENVVYNEELWVVAVDAYGNESQPVVYSFTVSTEKPATDAELKSDPNIPTGKPEITVTGAPAASYNEELEAVTRVTVSLDGEYQYVTLVKTGEKVDLFTFEGRQWYRVKLVDSVYETVEAIEIIGEGFTLTEDHKFYPLFTHYGDLKISFENGYGDMTPTVGKQVFETARDGSYMADPNYFTVRYAARDPESLEVNKVDFGQMIIMTENEDVELESDPERYLGYEIAKQNSDKGEAAVLFNGVRKRINPMRGTQIYFTLSNLLRSDWNILDVDFERSYIELHRINEEGDAVVDTVQGLAGTETQFYTVPDKYEDGGDFVTGQYYLRVYVVSGGGSVSFYDSSSMVLDANVPVNDGLWSYSYQLPFGIEGDNYSWERYEAQDKPFASVGASVTSTTGEIYRSRMFAAYSSGITGMQLELSTCIDIQTYEGITVGEIEGFRFWNKLSAPTDEEIEAQPFINQNYEDSIFIYANLDHIYTEESIPKGVDGFDDREINLVKGVNTICYQIKMANGYVSPVKQFTFIVTDKAPVLNIVIDDYVPSHYTYQGEEGITNAHSMRLAVESAYSLNGSGLVDVSVVASYGMTVGKYSGEGEDRTLNESFYADPDSDHYRLHRIVSGLKAEDYAIITQNSYTANYPPVNDSLCTAVFVAIDEYGGMTVVAPQIGDHIRVDNWGGSTDYEYNINYDGGLTVDPYEYDGEQRTIYTRFNQPTYYGKIVTGYQNTVSYDGGSEEIVVEESNPDLSYNLFNIVTNDVKWSGAAAMYGRHNGLTGSMMTVAYSGVSFSENPDRSFYSDNFELINWDSAVITFSGGDLEHEVTVPLKGGVANDAGYIGGGYYTDADGYGCLDFRVASVPLPEGMTVKDLPLLDQLKGSNPETGEEYDIAGHFYRNYVIKGYNVYGDYFEKSGQVAMFYSPYGVAEYYDEVNKRDVEGTGIQYIENPNNDRTVFVPGYIENMTAHGIDLVLSTPVLELQGDVTLRTGMFENGEYRRTLTDYYGNPLEIVYTLTEATDTGTTIKYSTADKTAKPVEITIERADGTPIYIDVTDYSVMSVEGNGTASVKVTVLQNIEFSYKYLDGEDEIMQMLSVDNIVKPDPKIIWSFNENEVLVDDESGVVYRYGSVTAYLMDDSFTLLDQYTGKAPVFTFYPEGETFYVFEAGTILATVGEESVVLDESITVSLPIELRSAADPLGIFDPITGERLEDVDTPDVQILAYSNQNGYFADKKLALQIESARHSSAMRDREGYKTLEYSGSRANAAELLEALGWGTEFRFEIEISDRSRTRLFVKEGLYAESPDFEAGYSDQIEGVTLNSRLLDVKEAAEFTLFIVDKENNATAIAFDVQNIGDTPVPTVAKVALSHERVRAYVIPPAGIDSGTFKISSADIGVDVAVESDENSEYFGLQYVEYTNNDDYLINYTYIYNGMTVEGVVDASVIEINVDRVALVEGGLEWSHSKSLEATTLDVTATLTFTHTISQLKTVGEVDSEKVRFGITGNKVTVTYLDNHPQIELICIAENGTRVPVILDEVDNVDRAAPTVELVSIERAANGLSATVTMRTNERAVFRQGGYVGELSEDGYYYFTRRVTENGSYTYHFADVSGLVTELTVEVNVIVTEELTILYSLSSSGENAVNTPALLEISIGDIVYIQPSRNAVIRFNNGEEIVADSDSWTAITVLDTLGGYLPYIVAVDEFGNVLTQQFSEIQIPDGTPPQVSVIKHTYSVVVGSDREEVEKALLANFNAYDDDADLTFKVVFTEDLSVTGVTNVEYIAIDSAGNVGRAVGRLRVASGAEPWVYVDGKQVDRDASVILSEGDEVKIKVNAGGRSFRVFIKEGVKTVAQMKIGSTTVQDYSATSDDISLGDLESGKYYTVCVLTQDRDYFRFIIYVE